MIKKLLLIALLAVIAYCYWPRHPDLLAYQPREMAALQTEALQQAAGKQWFAHGVTYFKIYTGQYGIPPLAAVGTALDTTRAVSLYRSSTDQDDKAEAVKPLTAAFESIKKETGKSYDPKAVAELEIKIWALVQEGAGNDVLAGKIAEKMALLYGGLPKQYLTTATFFAGALKESQAPAWPVARQNLQKGWADLQRSARTK